MYKNKHEAYLSNNQQINIIIMMTFDQIINDLKKKDYKAIYFLMGEESFYIDQITNYIANNVLSESEKAFNQNNSIW